MNPTHPVHRRVPARLILGRDSFSKLLQDHLHMLLAISSVAKYEVKYASGIDKPLLIQNKQLYIQRGLLRKLNENRAYGCTRS